jgi:hypothetical protein
MINKTESGLQSYLIKITPKERYLWGLYNYNLIILFQELVGGHWEVIAKIEQEKSQPVFLKKTFLFSL